MTHAVTDAGTCPEQVPDSSLAEVITAVIAEALTSPLHVVCGRFVGITAQAGPGGLITARLRQRGLLSEERELTVLLQVSLPPPSGTAGETTPPPIEELRELIRDR